VWEGEPPPEPTPDSSIVARCWNMLSNGSGGLDWQGLPLAVEMYSVDDVEALIEGLLVIKTHKPDVAED
jgi:hypothetical protein